MLKTHLFCCFFKKILISDFVCDRRVTEKETNKKQDLIYLELPGFFHALNAVHDKIHGT